MSGHRRIAPFVSFLLISVVTFSLTFMIACAGTAGNSSATNAGGSSPNGASAGGTSAGGSGGTSSGGTSSGGSTSGGGSSGGSGGSGGSGNNMSNAIYGVVMDQSTKAPINGHVAVALEKMAGDFQLVQQVMADKDGNFVFNNVAPNENYAVVFNARDANNTFYTPLTIGGGVPWNAPSITPGTNLGKIALTVTADAGGQTLGMQVTSTSAAHTPTPITAQFVLRTFVADFEFTMPWIEAAPTVTTGPTTTCADGTTPCPCPDPTTACGNATLTVPTNPVQFQVYGSGQPPSALSTQVSDTIHALAFDPVTRQPDCSPSAIDAYPDMSRRDNFNPTVIQFQGCQ